MPVGVVGSRSTATRFKFGAICLSSSSHLPLMPYSNCAKPVMLPPGRARLATYPAPTGSVTLMNTIGTLRVASINGCTADVPLLRMTSGASATISAARRRNCASLPGPTLYSIWMLRPTVQPNSPRA